MPIVLNNAQVTAILEGGLLQIREPIPNAPTEQECIGSKISIGSYYGKDQYQFMDVKKKQLTGQPFTCPFIDDGKPPTGDTGKDYEYQLWVKEQWRVGAYDGENGMLAIDYMASPDLIFPPWVCTGSKAVFDKFYDECTEDCIKADSRKSEDGYVWDAGCSPCRVREAIDMQHWASRLLLDIIDISIETTGDSTKGFGAEWVLTVKNSDI